MKTIIKFITALCLLFSMIACDNMNSLHEDDLKQGEILYTGIVDSVKALVGNNRIQFSWLINADPRIKKTVIYWNEGRDSSVIDVNRTADGILLMEKELNIPEGSYIFEFVTKDNNEHRSLSVELPVEIYGEKYGSLLANRDISSMTVSSGPDLNIVWSGVVSNALLYSTLVYTDHSNPSNPVQKTIRVENDDLSTFLPGIRLEPFTVVSTYKPTGGLDEVNAQTRSYLPYIAENNMLIANGFTEYTAEKAASITQLTYPMHANSFQDLYYFLNLNELDLTGTGFQLSKLTYFRNDVYGEIGGGEWLPFMRKAGNMSDANILIIKELLESGQLTKIRYIPHSLGLDELFEPYIASGVVELVDLPAEVSMPYKFYINGVVESTNFRIDLTYPATDAPEGTGLENIYKMTLVARCGSLAFALPTEYQFNIKEYRYLKFKVNTPPAELLSDGYTIYRRIWIRFMNRLWGFPNNSAFAQELFEFPRGSITIQDDQLNQWTDITVDLSVLQDRHSRVIIITPGEEANTATFPPEIDRVYYFSNIRFTKDN